MKNIFLVCFVSILVVIPGYAQEKNTGTIKGVVRMEDSTPLPGVMLRLEGTRYSALSNTEGEYTIPNVKQGKHTILASLGGFEENRKTVYVLAGVTVAIDFVLQLSRISEETTVTAEKPLLSASGAVSKITLTPRQIEALPSLGEKDIFRAFQLLPGISGSNETSSGLYVRGGTPDQNLILYDGMTIYHVDHLFGYFSAFNMEAIKEVHMNKGGFEAKYGGRLSSVMELVGAEGQKDKWGFGAGLSLLSLNGLIEVPLFDIGSLMLAGRRSFQSPLYDSIVDLIRNDTGGQQAISRPGRGGGMGGGGFSRFETEPSSYFYDLNARLSLDFSKKDRFFVSFYNGKDDLDNSREMNAPSFFQDQGIDFKSNITDLTEWGNTGVSLNWSRDWASIYTSELTASYSKFFNNRERNMEMDITVTEDIDFPNFFKMRNRRSGLIEDNDVNDLTLRWNNIVRLSENNQLELGIQFTKHDISYNYDTQEPEETEVEEEDEEEAPPRPFFNVLDRSAKAHVIAGFIQDQWTLFDRLTVTPGIRLTYFDLTEETYWEPRFSFSLNLTEKLRLKGAWGQYFQFVSRIVREDVFQGNREFWSLADGDSIPVGSAVHYIAGLSYDTEMFLFDCELYYKDLDGLTEFAPRSSVFFQDIDSSQFFYQGTGVAKGLEFLLQKKFGDLTGWISYTLGSVEYNFPDLSEALFPAIHDQTHELKAVGIYEISDWTFSATWIYATGKPYTPPEGIETIILPSGRTRDQVKIGDKNSARLPDYKRLDLSVNYRFMMGDWKTTIGASLFNVLDWTNVWYKEFDVIEGEIVETDVTLMGMTFNVFLNVRF